MNLLIKLLKINVQYYGFDDVGYAWAITTKCIIFMYFDICICIYTYNIYIIYIICNICIIYIIM